MRIGILITSIGNFGKKGFYNAQEVGLAKALAKKVDAVDIYKLVQISEPKKTERVMGYRNVKIHFITARNFGINGILCTSKLDRNLDVLIHFSDTQFSVPAAYHWCRKNSIQYIPYIGVVESHSTSKIKQLITNFMFVRNISVYKKCVCCVKTPAVENELKDLGILHTAVAPVGLDTELLRVDYEQYDLISLKKKYGYQPDDRVLLFIGRMIDEKQPVRMVDIFSKLHQQNDKYKLLMVGAGELKATVEARIKECKLEENTRVIERIPNSEIWELYRMADSFVNLNQQEIFGMAILEAMYYGCKVVAWNAPGPDFIIENGISGWLVESNEKVIDRVTDTTEVGFEAHQRIINHFTWDNMADCVCSLVRARKQ